MTGSEMTGSEMTGSEMTGGEMAKIHTCSYNWVLKTLGKSVHWLCC